MRKCEHGHTPLIEDDLVELINEISNKNGENTSLLVEKFKANNWCKDDFAIVMLNSIVVEMDVFISWAEEACGLPRHKTLEDLMDVISRRFMNEFDEMHKNLFSDKH